MSYFNARFNNRYGARRSSEGYGRSPSPSYSHRNESAFGFGSRADDGARYQDSYNDEPRYRSRFGFCEPSQSRRDRSPSPPPRRSEQFHSARDYATEGAQYMRRMRELFALGMGYEAARAQVKQEMEGAARCDQSYDDEGSTRSREQFTQQLSEYAKRRLEELFSEGVGYERARVIAEAEEAERNSQRRPPPRPRSKSPPRRRQSSYNPPRDEAKPRARHNAGEPMSEYAQCRMADLEATGMDYETARKIVEEEEAEAKPKERSGKRDIYSDWDSHPNAGTKERYQIPHEDMKHYIRMMEGLVRGGMSREEAVKLIDEEIHSSFMNSGRRPGSESSYDPPPRSYSSSNRRDDGNSESGRDRDDESRYRY